MCAYVHQLYHEDLSCKPVYLVTATDFVGVEGVPCVCTRVITNLILLVMFLSEWREFPLALCLAGKKKLDGGSRLDFVENARVA